MATADVTTIRARMARIRSRAQGKAVRLSRETKQLFNWKSYVRMAPWGVIGGAVLAGYLLVPARRAPKYPVAEAVVPPPPPPPPPPVKQSSPGLLSSLTRFAVNAAMRTAVTYAGQAVGQYLAHLQHSAGSYTRESDVRHDVHAS